MIIRNIVAILVSMLCFMVSAATYSVDNLPNVQKTDRNRHLVNPDGIVSEATQAQIDSLLMDLRQRSSAEVVAVVVDDIDTDIDEFTTELFRKWGVGKKDKNNGVVIVVVKNSREAVIRTGYGDEGVLPDILCGRIIRNDMAPHFKDGDFDGGMLEAVRSVHRIITDPDAAAELMSQEEDNYQSGGSDINLLKVYLILGLIAGAGALLWVVVMYFHRWRGRRLTDYDKYATTSRAQTALWIVSAFFIGIPLVAALLLFGMRRYWRNHPRRCPRCNGKMEKLSEERDNDYLNYAQDLEERIKSVDYDVWKCPHCGEKDIYSFINHSSSYLQCPDCHARTMKLNGVRVLREPTYSFEGVGEKRYVCLNCNHQHGESYKIPKKQPPVVVVGGGGGRGGGGGFGGGSFGGGFGGGMTGGGGARGGW